MNGRSLSIPFLFMLAACTAVSDTDATIAPDPILLYDAEDVDGSGNPFTSQCSPTTWVDTSTDIIGDQNNATVNIGGDCAGLYGWRATLGSAPRYVNLNGSTQSITTSVDADSASMPSATWLLWFNPSRVNHTSNQHLLSVDNGSGGFFRSSLIAASSSNVGIFTGAGLWAPGATVTVGDWQFMAAVFSSSNILLYKDENIYSLGSAPVTEESTETLSLGASNTGLSEHYQGAIAWAAVYDRQLSANDIRNSCESVRLQRFPLVNSSVCD